jgi:flagellar hook-basal body complex protein FliE
MELRLTPPTTVGVGAPRPARLPGLEAGAGAAAGAVPEAGGFGQAFKTALHNVSAAQDRAGRLQTEFQLGNPNVSLEQTMLAMQKSQIGFQAALHVRNRMMQAYTDVMNMQV